MNQEAFITGTAKGKNRALSFIIENYQSHDTLLLMYQASRPLILEFLLVFQFPANVLQLNIQYEYCGY